MSIVNPLPAIQASNFPDPTEIVLAKLHQKIALALRAYNQHIAWLNEQLVEGNISHNTLIDLISKPLKQQTHQTPIAKAIDARFIDPTMASIVDNIQTQLPNHLVHMTAKLLSMKQLSLDAFPPICHENAASSSATIS